MKKFFVLVLALGFIFAGCAQKTAVQSDQPEGRVKAEAGKEEKKEELTAKSTPKKEYEKFEVVPVKEVREGGAVRFIFQNIHFDFDKYNIRDDARPILHGISDWLLKSNSSKLLIEGHCDDRGTNEYNLALGERRAKSTKDYLVSLGTIKSRLDIISYGEEKPLCKEENENCWQKNRRSQFVAK